MRAPLFPPKFTITDRYTEMQAGPRTPFFFFLLPNTHPACHRKTGTSIKFRSAGHSPFPDVVTIPFTPDLRGQKVQFMDLMYLGLNNWLSKIQFSP